MDLSVLYLFFLTNREGFSLSWISNPLISLFGTSILKWKILIWPLFLLRKGNWMVQVDLKDASLPIPVHPANFKFLHFEWKGRIFNFNCLSSSLFPCTENIYWNSQGCHGVFEKAGNQVNYYLDDTFILYESQERTAKDFTLVVDLLQQLGFLVNWGKAAADPTKKIEYLGQTLDLCRLSLALPTSKALAVRLMCESALTVDSLS